MIALAVMGMDYPFVMNPYNVSESHDNGGKKSQSVKLALAVFKPI